MRRAAQTLGVLAAALALGLTHARAAPAPVVQAVRLTLREWAVEPREIIVQPGRMRFVVRNAGRRQHRFGVLGPGQTSAVNITSDNIAAGGTLTVDVDLARQGTYLIYCDIEGHRDRGMEGRLIVARGAGSPGSSGSSPAAPFPSPGSGSQRGY